MSSQQPAPASSQPAPRAARAVSSRLDPEVRTLTAGPWTVDLVGDEFGPIAYRGRTVLRAVRAVVRDHDWRTLEPSVQHLEITGNGAGLQVSLQVGYAGYGARYAGRLTVRLAPEAVEVHFDGHAVAGFRSNRIGLVVLHPPGDAGRAVTVIGTDGSAVPAHFPVEISPHQPFLDIAALEWADAGTVFTLSFTGDVFETEDQRNWTDASFKTYSTPLSRPFPVSVGAGDLVRQGLRLQAAAGRAAAVETAFGGSGRAEPAAIGGAVSRVPPLALAAGEGAGVGANHEALPPLPGLDAILVELTGPEDQWETRLDAAARQAARHGAALDVRVVTAAPERTAAALADWPGRIARLAVFDPASHVTEPGAWPAARSALLRAGFRGQLLAGTRAHFTELNRNSGRLPTAADALTFSITPQMHSTEVRHLVETVPMQRLAAQQALRLAAGRPVHVGPVTLRPRFNAVASSGNGPAAESDELQAEPFTAAWTLASIAALSLDGVASVCYFETAGPRGISAADGTLYPVGELLRRLAALRGAPVLAVPATGAVTLYPVRTPEAILLFAGNLSPRPAETEVLLPAGSDAAEATVLGAGAGSSGTLTARDGRRLRLALQPWSTMLVRIGRGAG
ncbi:hypothetical protein LVY72_13440 [Arthrobacter sp. I2-34]|uniref:Uncharacterized protein n=1 Tax=Arthrobacter hankyongi TaxID=2904801 RepID=A0ABS9L8A2_9MICC|nr:hypothetical protein [Arthrobacter hankyongi]MCG2622902.1 hypothetical protein [Arthrobacter hankyongi]